jgi:bacteriocin-like protein
VLRLVKEEGYELSEEELAKVAGGEGFWEYCEGYQHCYHF